MNRTRITCAVALAAATFSFAPMSQATELGGKTSFTGTIFLTATCNAKNISIENANITVAAKVDADLGYDNTTVSVDASYSGIVADTKGNKYRLLGVAHATYDTLSIHYTLPMLIDVDGINGAPSFNQLQDTIVNVDPATQRPLTVPGVGLVVTCG